MTTKTLAGPKIKTALPGPNAKRVLSGDEKYVSPSYTRSYPLVAKHGRGHRSHGRGRKQFFRFLRRHCRDLYRTLPSRYGCCHPEAGWRTDPHVGHRFLLREHGDPGGRGSPNRAHAWAARGFTMATLVPRRSKRAQTGPLSHQAAERDCLPGRVSTAAPWERSR